MPFDCCFFAGALLLCTEPLTFVEGGPDFVVLVVGRTCFAAMASTFSAALCATTVLIGWVIKLLVLVSGSLARTILAGLVLCCCCDGFELESFGRDGIVGDNVDLLGRDDVSVAFAEILTLCGGL
jgi:hypothetical protein